MGSVRNITSECQAQHLTHVLRSENICWMKWLTKRKLHLIDNHIFFMVYIIYTFGIKKSVSKYIFNMETVRDFIFLDFKITTDNGCSHEIERHLLLGRKAMTNLLLLLLLSRFSHVRLCATPETTAHQAPQSLGFSRQEHRSGLPFPSTRLGKDII